MSETTNKVKDLMARYDRAQRAGNEAASLRKQIVPLLKDAGLTKTKFNFGDRVIMYYNYNDYENITQKLVKSVIAQKYPQLNAEQFVADLYAARKCKSIETLRSQKPNKRS